MAHFAYIENNEVIKVHVVANAAITDDDGVEQEELGKQLLADLHGYQKEKIIQCSYNGTIRGNYPGRGFTYDSDLDAFIGPQPFPSWVLNQQTFQWLAPVSYPTDGAVYTWDEEAGDWVAVETPGA